MKQLRGLKKLINAALPAAVLCALVSCAAAPASGAGNRRSMKAPWPYQYGAKTITAEYLSAPNALWQTVPQSGAKGMSAVPRGATGQFSYTILPGK